MPVQVSTTLKVTLKNTIRIISEAVTWKKKTEQNQKQIKKIIIISLDLRAISEMQGHMINS